MADDADIDVDAATASISRMRISTRVAPGPPGSIPVPCRYFLAGHCANGASCRFEHPERRAAPSTPASIPAPVRVSLPQPVLFARPQASDFVAPSTVIRPPHSGYVGFAAAYASVFDEADDEDDTDALLRAAAAPATAAPAFLTSVHAAQGSTYAAAAAPEDGTRGYPVVMPMSQWVPRMPAVSTVSESHSPVRSTKGALCRFHIAGDCRYGQRCRYVHGVLCDICGKNALHPDDEEEMELHRGSCRSEKERKERMKGSETVECGICYEKPVAIERKFGLLQNCDHAFCLSCIREWRGADSVGTFGREAVRVCPVCRTESFLVIPSDTYESDKEVREQLLAKYKERLSSIPCKHFDFGRGTCPFGGSCMYAHTDAEGRLVAAPERPPLLVSDSGVRVKTHARLADYLPPAR